MPVMRPTNQRAYHNDSARHPQWGFVAGRQGKPFRALAFERVFDLLAGILQA
jgi:hypothetical protein